MEPEAIGRQPPIEVRGGKARWLPVAAAGEEMWREISFWPLALA